MVGNSEQFVRVLRQSKVNPPNVRRGECFTAQHAPRGLCRACYGQGPCNLIVSLKSSPSERKVLVVPSIVLKNATTSSCCCTLSVVAIVVTGGNIAPWGPNPCNGRTSSKVWAWPRCRY